MLSDQQDKDGLEWVGLRVLHRGCGSWGEMSGREGVPGCRLGLLIGNLVPISMMRF